MASFEYSALFNTESPQAKQVYGNNLLPDLTMEEDNFWGRHGLIANAGLDEGTDAPIQKIPEVEMMRGTTFNMYIDFFLTGEPQVGANSIARDDARAIPQQHFSFKTTVMYATPLQIPHEHDDQQMVISTVASYQRQLSILWANTFTELITTVFCGLRGQQDNYYAWDVPQEGTSQNIARSIEGTFSNAIVELSKVNKITAPQRLHDTWRGSYDFSTAIDPTSATANDKTTPADFNSLCTYLESRTTIKEGFTFKKPSIRFRDNESRGMRVRKGWMKVITPEIAHDIRSVTGSGTWAEAQLAIAGATGFNQGITDSVMGELYGITMVKFNRLPRYWGGAAGNVPITRCMIPAAQAIVVAIRNKQLPPEYQAKMHPRLRRASQLGAPVKTWLWPTNGGRTARLESSVSCTVAKITFTDPRNGKTVDKGVFCMDSAYTSIEGSNTL